MAESLTADSVRRDIHNGKIAPVYLLHGEEGFFTDLIAKELEGLVAPDDRDFDLTLIYAPESTPGAVIEAARRYPMMSPRQVVIVREIQAIKTPGQTPTAFLNALAEYAKTPSPTTVLCLCFRGEKAAGAEFTKAIKAGGGIPLESVKLKDRALQSAVSRFISDRGLSVDQKALEMLSEFVGSDLSRLYNEVNKLTVTLGRGARITPEVVERNIGMSKEYNTFELIRAIGRRDSAMAFRILDAFAGNPKAHPPQAWITNIFTLFSNLLCVHYSKDKSDRGLMAELGVKSPWALTDVKNAMAWCGAWQTIEIISLIREFDANTKGIRSRQQAFDLARDLLFHILNPVGPSGLKW